MKKTKFLGDIHGNGMILIDALEKGVDLVQVGDLGIGFGIRSNAEVLDEILVKPVLQETGKSFSFIRGNHDNPSEVKNSQFFIKDGTVTDDGVMFLGGAASIDYMLRTENIDWWKDEELSNDELEEIVSIWEDEKPEVLVSHDTSESFASKFMMPLVNSKIVFPSRTRDAIEKMYEAHKPKIHIFGHWHHTVDFVDESTGTRMVCLNINETKDIEL